MIFNKNPFCIIIQFPFWFGRWTGLTLAPFIFVKDITNRTVVEHEKIHIHQQYKHLIIGFYIWYLMQLFSVGYKRIDYEIEAYKHQDDWKNE